MVYGDNDTELIEGKVLISIVHWHKADRSKTNLPFLLQSQPPTSQLSAGLLLAGLMLSWPLIGCDDSCGGDVTITRQAVTNSQQAAKCWNGEARTR